MAAEIKHSRIPTIPHSHIVDRFIFFFAMFVNCRKRNMTCFFVRHISIKRLNDTYTFAVFEKKFTFH